MNKIKSNVISSTNMMTTFFNFFLLFLKPEFYKYTNKIFHYIITDTLNDIFNLW